MIIHLRNNNKFHGYRPRTNSSMAMGHGNSKPLSFKIFYLYALVNPNKKLYYVTRWIFYILDLLRKIF